MPDFGIKAAIEAAMEAAKSVEVMRPAEQKLAQAAAKGSPRAPVIPDAVPSPAPTAPGVVARTPSAAAPPTVGQPSGPSGIPIDPSKPPVDVSPGDAAATAQPPAGAVPAPADVNASNPGEPPPGALAAATAPEITPPPSPDSMPPVALPNALPPGAKISSVDPVTGVRTVTMPDGSMHTIYRPATIQEEAQRFVQAQLSDFEGKLNMVHLPNPDTSVSPDKIKAIVLQVADDNQGAIMASRRGIVSDEQLTRMAAEYITSHDVVKEVLERRLGVTLDQPEKILAARMVGESMTGNLLGRVTKMLQDSGSSEDWIQLRRQMQEFSSYVTELQGLKAEQARGTRAMGIPTGLPDDVSGHIADLIKQDDPDLMRTMKAIKMASTPNGVSAIINGWALKPMWQRVLGYMPYNMMNRVFINGILSGGSLVRIMTGNTTNLLKHQFDLFAAGIGRGTVGLAAHNGSYLTAEEGATLGDAWAHLHGVMAGFSDAWRVAGRVLRTGIRLDDVMAGRAAEGATRTTSATLGQMFPEADGTWLGSLIKGIDRVTDFPGQMVGAADEFTKTLGYRGYATMLAVKKARVAALKGELDVNDIEKSILETIQNPDPGIAQASEAWAHRITFQTPFYISPDGSAGAMQTFSTLIQKAPGLRFIFPFMRTAYNIAAQGTFETMPLLNALSARTRAAIAAGGADRDIALARLATGGSFVSLGAWMAINDRLTGAEPRDPKERALWEAEGRRPYSVRMPTWTMTKPGEFGPDVWRSYSDLEPVATIWGLTADAVKLQSYVHQMGQDNNTMLDLQHQTDMAISHIVASAIENFGNKGFMQGAAAFSEMYNDPQRYFEMWKDQLVANMVPYSGLGKLARNIEDPYLREAKTLMEKVENNLPFLSRNNPARMDIFGEPRERQGGNGLMGPLSPMPASPTGRDRVVDELTDIMQRTHTVPVGMPPQRLALMGGERGIEGGMGYQLSPQEYLEYIKHSRHEKVFDGGTMTLKDKLLSTIQSSTYQSLTPAERSDVLTQITSAADKAGAGQLYYQNPGFRNNITQWKEREDRVAHGR